jgi:polyferredoxin
MATSVQTENLSELPQNFPPLAGREASRLRPKKKLVRRTDRDYSQTVRRSFQFVFLAWNVYLGGLFYSWVRHFETGSVARTPVRPPGVEGWLPIAGMMNFKYWLLTGHVPAIHPAAMFLLTFVAISFLFRKAFCSWLCPVGTISEALARLGQKLFRRNFHLHRWIDIPLRGLKYLLLGFFVWAVSSMSAPAIASFMHSPYGVIADVKMLNFFRHIGEVGLIVLGVLVVASILVQNFWCRYLCPYGALLGLSSIFSPAKIRRNPDACIDCAKCAKACPSVLPVDKLITIKSAECTGCLECVAVCPAQDALALVLPVPLKDRPQKLPAWAMAAGIAVLFVGIVGYAKTAGFWNTNLPRQIYVELVPRADQASHPMPGDPALSE